MLTRLLDWVAGREPVASATGIAAVVTAALGVGAAFGLDISAEQIAAIGALAAALAGWAARRVVTPVDSPADRQVRRLLSVEDVPPQRGSVPLALIILLLLGAVVMGGLATCGDALFEDEDEVNDLGAGRIVLISHDAGCDPRWDDCGGYDDRYGEEPPPRGQRDGGRRRDKRTCFFGCDNIIIVPGLPGQGGDEPPPEERYQLASLVPPTPDKIIQGIQTMADAGINLGSTIARLVVDYVITVFRFLV